jgi:transcriptional regulator GlxA family with amidase domain
MNTKVNHIQNWPELALQAKWSASALAKKCNVSLRTLERHFVKHMGKSPKKWLSEQRQLRAVELLQDGNSVKETAGYLGYKHATHFSREFKDHWAYLPTQAKGFGQMRVRLS